MSVTAERMYGAFDVLGSHNAAWRSIQFVGFSRLDIDAVAPSKSLIDIPIALSMSITSFMEHPSNHGSLCIHRTAGLTQVYPPSTMISCPLV